MPYWSLSLKTIRHWFDRQAPPFRVLGAIKLFRLVFLSLVPKCTDIPLQGIRGRWTSIWNRIINTLKHKEGSNNCYLYAILSRLEPHSLEKIWITIKESSSFWCNSMICLWMFKTINAMFSLHLQVSWTKTLH